MLGAFFGGFEILFILAAMFMIPIGIAIFAFWIWMLIDCIKNESHTGNEKVAWVLVIALTHWLGALIYFFAGRSGRRAVAAP
jgi:Phospholipase_D-nuclease N-terminal